jgi:MFS family permease
MYIAMNNVDKYFWVTLFQSAGFLSPVITLFFIHRGLSYPQIFIVTLIVLVCMFLFEVPTGIFADRYGRKTSIIVGLSLILIASILLIWANSFIFFLMIYALAGIATAFLSGSGEAMVFDSLKEEGKEGEMKKYMARLNVASFLPVVITAPIGAFIAKDLAESQFILILMLGSLFFLLSLLMSFTLREPRARGMPRKKSSLDLFKSSFNDMRKSPILVRLFINKTLVLIMCSHIFGTIWQPYLKDSGVPIIWFGVLVAISALMIAYLSSRIDAIEKHIPNKKFIFLTALLAFIAFLLGAFIRNIYFAIALYLVIRIVLWMRDPIFSHYINQHIESHNRATMLSAMAMVVNLFAIVLLLLAGAVASVGLNFIFILCAIVILVAIVFFSIKDEHILDLRKKQIERRDLGKFFRKRNK